MGLTHIKLNGRQGAVSLEALGMMLDPMKRELRPLPMPLGSHTLSL